MKEKCLQYYMDSKEYTTEQVQTSINETKKEFANKKVHTKIELNEFGVYIITFYFESKDTIWNRIRIFFRRKDNKKMLVEKTVNQTEKRSNECNNKLEKYYGNSYGQYKTTREYKPL